VYLGVLVFALRSIWLLVPAFLLGTPLLLVFLIRRWPKLIPFDMPPTMRRLDKALDNLAIPIVLLLAYGVFHLLVKRGQLG
jgi:hypothetical protein